MEGTRREPIGSQWASVPAVRRDDGVEADHHREDRAVPETHCYTMAPSQRLHPISFCESCLTCLT